MAHTMIAAETSRLTLTAPAQRDPSLFARLAALLTRVAHTTAETQAAEDEAVWTSVARGF